jgi:hypothetical protein
MAPVKLHLWFAAPLEHAKLAGHTPFTVAAVQYSTVLFALNASTPPTVPKTIIAVSNIFTFFITKSAFSCKKLNLNKTICVLVSKGFRLPLFPCQIQYPLLYSIFKVYYYTDTEHSIPDRALKA